MDLGIVCLLAGCLLIIMTKGAVKLEKIKEKSRLAWLLNLLGEIILGIVFPIWLYGITDTLKEWLLATLLLFSIFGIMWGIGWVIKKLQRRRWILPVMVLPVVGLVCWQLTSYMIAVTISRDSNALIVGIVTGLVCTVHQAAKEEKGYYKLMLAEVIGMYLIVITVGHNLLSETKPVRLIETSVNSYLEKGKQAIISEGLESPRRGESASFSVFIKNNRGQLEEVRYYSYFEGRIVEESVQKFD